ncbi:zinc finger BED domain-containing protein RICESLEEPER 2-like [Rutidosis leptorrhynchoides]|uniref:zinc finger BED domain-containing protein RICESLEEPER 2-like n=1 Tax=Rutidosis leptorrhynchoides TaxID=125765 RepID=UPI003A9A1E00
MTFLELFVVVTKRFSRSLYVTSNTCFHDFFTIYTHITTFIEDVDPKLSHMACDMKLNFDNYWGELENVNPLLFVAVVLDPRYKKQYVDWSFEKMYGINDVSNKMKKSVTKILKNMFDHYSAQDSEGEKYELDKYLKEERVSMDGDFDLLVWWKLNSTKYKVLSQVAKDVLAIPVSTVSSQSVFKTGGRVLSTFKSSLTLKMVQSLICSQNWLKSKVTQERVDIQGALQDIEDLEDIDNDFAILVDFPTDHI